MGILQLGWKPYNYIFIGVPWKGLYIAVGNALRKTHQPQALKGRNRYNYALFRAQIQIVAFTRRALPYAI